MEKLRREERNGSGAIVAPFYRVARERGGVIVNEPADEDRGGQKETTADSMLGGATARTLLEEWNKFVTGSKSSSVRTVLVEHVLGQKTFQEVGDILNVTRQRVDQIEKKLRPNLAELPWVQSLQQRLLALLSRRSEPLFLDLEFDDPWFSGWSSRARELAGLICFFRWEDPAVLRSQDRYIVSRISQKQFDSVRENIASLLAQKVSEKWSREQVQQHIEDEMRSQDAPELAGYVIELLRPELHFSFARGTEKEILCSVGSGMNEIIMAIVENAAGPLHFSEIAGALSVRMAQELTDRNIHARLSRIPALLFFGRGRYGSQAHYPLSADAEVEVADMVEDIMAAAPDRQWQTEELLKAMEARGEDVPDELDKYILNILLSRSKEFLPLGRMTWSLKARRQTDASGRINLMDACAHVLIASGRALHGRELKEKIGVLRGTGEFFFIQPTEKMARVAPNKWGLIDRDFVLAPKERATFLDNLESALEEKAVSLHISELPTHNETRADAPFKPTAYMLMGLVQTDPRFTVHRGHLIALKTWNDPRRHNIASAVEQCAGDGRTEVNVAEFVAEVAALVGRDAQRDEVTLILLKLGWRRRGVTETYFACLDDDEEVTEYPLDDLPGETDD